VFSYKTFSFLTKKYNELVLITKEIEAAVKESPIKNGLVTVLTHHTTTGIAVNEALECLESDIESFLSRVVPEDYPYVHARMLKDYGSTAGNPSGHIKAHLTGNHCIFPIVNGVIMKGGAQEVYFCEFDGPSKRTVSITIMGEA